MTDQTVVRLAGLEKSFGSLRVLRGIDLEVRRGEVVCIIGPSGSGKSTLLRCVNLLEQPNAGTVTVSGIELTDPDVDIDAARRRLAGNVERQDSELGAVSGFLGHCGQLRSASNDDSAVKVNLPLQEFQAVHLLPRRCAAGAQARQL